MNDKWTACSRFCSSRDVRQTASSGGLRASNGLAGGCATPTSFAARAGVEAVNALTFHPDQSVGADQVASRKDPIHDVAICDDGGRRNQCCA